MGIDFYAKFNDIQVAFDLIELLTDVKVTQPDLDEYHRRYNALHSLSMYDDSGDEAFDAMTGTPEMVAFYNYDVFAVGIICLGRGLFDALEYTTPGQFKHFSSEGNITEPERIERFMLFMVMSQRYQFQLNTITVDRYERISEIAKGITSIYWC